MADQPARFDGAALERVLARASELQAQQQLGDTGEGLTEAELLALGREVGLDAQTLRLAIAEEQSRAVVPREGGVAVRLLGSARVSAARTVTGRPEETLAALDEWMRRHEYLQVKRRMGLRAVWEPQRDLAASLARGAEQLFGGRAHAFSQAHEVAAFVTAVDESRVLVRLDADLSPVRSARVAAGLSIGAVLAAAGGVALAMGALPVIALIPAVAAPLVAFGTARAFRGPLDRARLAMEQVLDRLERGELQRRGSLLDALKQVTLPPGR